jgi:hypothetical protein
VVPYSAKKTYVFSRVASRTKSKGSRSTVPYSAKKLMLFTRVALHTKSKGLSIGGPLLNKKTYAFYTRSTTYKKQGAPDWRSTHLLLLSARASPRTKSKGLPFSGPHIFYYFQHALHRVQKARGSIGMGVKFVISVIKFPKYFADQRVSLSLSIIQTMSHQIPIGGSIYFSYIIVITIREVRGIHLYSSASSSSSVQKKERKITKPWGCRCHRTRQD